MYTKSQGLLQYSKNYIVGGIKGMHKVAPETDFPAYFAKGKGAYVWDIDGNEYIDFVMGKGPYILGYHHQKVDDAVCGQIANGNIFASGSPLHTELAEVLCTLIPSAKKVLFYKTGSCATSAAARIARHFTGKHTIFSSGYHGWHSWCNPETQEEKQGFKDFQYDLSVLELMLERSESNAAVMITPEPIYFSDAYYLELQDICQKHDLLFILDEVKTGFRVSLNGFQGKHHLSPDISIFSKAMANGYSISALLGKDNIMNVANELHTAGTYDIELTSFAAALATISELRAENDLDIIEKNGRYFVHQLDILFKARQIPIYPVWAEGSFRFWFFDDVLERDFYKYTADNGVLLYPYDNSFLSASHNIDVLNRAIENIELAINGGLEKYCGAYREFSFSKDIQRMKNKKGFLSNYPGVNGRHE